MLGGRCMTPWGNRPQEASWLLARFQELDDIEDRAKQLTPEDRVRLRQSEALPVWQSMKEWLDAPQDVAILPKSELGKALGYLRNHWGP